MRSSRSPSHAGVYLYMLLAGTILPVTGCERIAASVPGTRPDTISHLPTAAAKTGQATPGAALKPESAPDATAGTVGATVDVAVTAVAPPERPVIKVVPSTLAPADSWSVCRLVGTNWLPGIGGADLGFSIPAPMSMSADQLTVLFGDTWARPVDACWFPPEKSDDLQATLPAKRPAVLGPGQPPALASGACSTLEFNKGAPDQAVTFRPIRLFADASSREPQNMLDMSFLRTPVTGFSDGTHSYGVFLRNEPSFCQASTDCPSGTTCSSELAGPLGVCWGTDDEYDKAPTFCVRPSICNDGSPCTVPSQGVCLNPHHPPGGPAEERPWWFREDPRRGLLSNVYIAAAVWPDRREDYVVGHRFATNKFINSVARTVANFNPEDPEQNDYRPGTHTLLMWGRPRFFSDGGAQAPLYLLYQPLGNLLDEVTGKVNFAPRFFAGYDPDSGQVRWSSDEVDAVPVYGMADDPSSPDGLITEFDVVNHGAITWVEPLHRWVMLYGGSIPDWMRTDIASGRIPDIVHEQPMPDAIHMRSAAHPFGRSHQQASADEAWTDAMPVVGPNDLDMMGCDTPDALPESGCRTPRDLWVAIQEIVSWATQLSPANGLDLTGACIAGNLALSYLYDLAGSARPHLYGTNIIDSWTDDITDRVPDLAPGERAVELYWNVSTWMPYQVLLVKTQLRAMVPEESMNAAELAP